MIQGVVIRRPPRREGIKENHGKAGQSFPREGLRSHVCEHIFSDAVLEIDLFALHMVTKKMPLDRKMSSGTQFLWIHSKVFGRRRVNVLPGCANSNAKEAQGLND